jgi:hypothetical protein
MSLEWALTVLLKSALVITVFLGAALGFALLLRGVFASIVEEDSHDQPETARLLRRGSRRTRQIGLADASERTAAKEAGKYDECLGEVFKTGQFCDLPYGHQGPHERNKH